jgi:hypothetical protein
VTEHEIPDDDPTAQRALLNVRLALRTADGTEFFESEAWLLPPDEITYEDETGAICFRYGDLRLSWSSQRREVFESREHGHFLDCRVLSETGRVLSRFRHGVGDVTLN